MNDYTTSLQQSCKSGGAFRIESELKIDQISGLIFVLAWCFRLLGAINWVAKNFLWFVATFIQKVANFQKKNSPSKTIQTNKQITIGNNLPIIKQAIDSIQSLKCREVVRWDRRFHRTFFLTEERVPILFWLAPLTQNHFDKYFINLLQMTDFCLIALLLILVMLSVCLADLPCFLTAKPFFCALSSVSHILQYAFLWSFFTSCSQVRKDHSVSQAFWNHLVSKLSPFTHHSTQWCRNGEGSCLPALLPGGARGAVLPFAFQYDSNEANACQSQSSLIQSRINLIVYEQ